MSGGEAAALLTALDAGVECGSMAHDCMEGEKTPLEATLTLLVTESWLARRKAAAPAWGVGSREREKTSLLAVLMRESVLVRRWRGLVAVGAGGLGGDQGWRGDLGVGCSVEWPGEGTCRFMWEGAEGRCSVEWQG